MANPRAIVCYQDAEGGLHTTKAAAINRDKRTYWYTILTRTNAHMQCDDLINNLDKHVAAIKAIEARYSDV